MPYIEIADRSRASECPRSPGELNFAITRLLDFYATDGAFCYARLNDCLGALEGAKAEFYRRVVVPYEERRKAAAGDVYTKRIVP